MERADFLRRLVGERVRFVVTASYTSISRDEGHGGIYAHVKEGDEGVIVGGVYPHHVHIKLDAIGHRVVPARLADFTWADAPVVIIKQNLITEF